MRLVIGHIFAAIDMTIAVAMLQGDLPLPARFMRRGAGVGQGAAAIFADTGQRHRPVAGQIIGPVFISGFQCLFDQQPAKTGAVDKQIAFDTITIVHGQ